MTDPRTGKFPGPGESDKAPLAGPPEGLLRPGDSILLPRELMKARAACSRLIAAAKAAGAIEFHISVAIINVARALDVDPETGALL